MAKSIPSRSSQAKKSSAARGTGKSTGAKAAGSKVVSVDRRACSAGSGKGERRANGDRRKQDEPVTVERRKLERREKVNRRRQIDPTTCEREYSECEVEFMNALEVYKRKNGRMFPTCSEILEVIISLGYRKAGEIEATPIENPEANALQDSTNEPDPQEFPTL